MGILDEIIKGMGSKILGGTGQSGMLDQVLGLVNNPQTGGLSGLVEQFTIKAWEVWLLPGLVQGKINPSPENR